MLAGARIDRVHRTGGWVARDAYMPPLAAAQFAASPNIQPV